MIAPLFAPSVVGGVLGDLKESAGVSVVVVLVVGLILLGCVVSLRRKKMGSKLVVRNSLSV